MRSTKKIFNKEMIIIGEKLLYQCKGTLNERL